MQALQSSRLTTKPRLTLVTANAVAPPSGVGTLDPGQAPLWGLGRVLAVEHPDLRCRLIDLQSNLEDPLTARMLARELVVADGESEFLLNGVERYVARVCTTTLAEQAKLSRHRAVKQARRSDLAEVPTYRLDFSAHGPLDNLFIAEAERRAPADGEVEIAVRAAGLNFRDVMWVMGMLPEEALENGFAGATIGMECAGEIARLGPGVAQLAVGDRVLAFAPGCFSNFVTTSIASVAPLPANLSFEAGATIPTAFLTAYYALVHLANLGCGERVLIHGAAGGVGLAAIQIAKRCGAEIFGTAGSAEKRAFLRRLGVDHVLDSRSLDFADDIMRITQGQGIDVVLNSLAGAAITKNFAVLKPFGRFLEIGKRDLYANSKIGLRPFRNNISYFGIDADTLLTGRNGLAERLLREVLDLFTRGELRPLPYRSFPLSRAVEAFRLMQQSRHMGKIVIAIDDDMRVLAPIKRQVSVRPDATYLISGGLSGFGLATARWLVNKGARNLALLGRSGAASEEARTGIAAMEASGATVRVCAADVSQEAAVAHAMDRIRENMPPVRGVIHAAMVLDDGVIANLDRARMRSVMAPKVEGAWNLHRATLQEPLDFFVLYSSATTFIGSPGQANYVAANMFLEALAEYRRGLGLPALAVSWGVLAEVGYIARNPTVIELARRRLGLEEIPPQQALAQLESLLGSGAACVATARLNWRSLSKGLPETARPRLSLVVGPELGDEMDHVADVRSHLRNLPSKQRKPFLVAKIKEHFARVLGTGAAEIDPDRPLLELGLDSLMGVELSEVMGRETQITIPFMELIQSGSIVNLADRFLRALQEPSDAPAVVPAPVAEPAQVQSPSPANRPPLVQAQESAPLTADGS